MYVLAQPVYLMPGVGVFFYVLYVTAAASPAIMLQSLGIREAIKLAPGLTKGLVINQVVIWPSSLFSPLLVSLEVLTPDRTLDKGAEAQSD